MVCTVIAACMLAGGAAATRTWVRAAMQYQVKGCRVTLYEDPHYKGARWTTTNGWAVIGWEFNDKISSIKIESGIWRFFKDDNFNNQLETLYPGTYPLLHPNSDNSISSFRCPRAT